MRATTPTALLWSLCSLMAVSARSGHDLIHTAMFRRAIATTSATSTATNSTAVDCTTICKPFNNDVNTCTSTFSANTTYLGRCLCQTGILSDARTCAACAASSTAYTTGQRQTAVEEYNEYLGACSNASLASAVPAPSAAAVIVAVASASASSTLKAGQLPLAAHRWRAEAIMGGVGLLSALVGAGCVFA